MGIQRIESVTYGIDDVAECVRFFDDFGLFLLERTDEHAVFETLTGQTLHLDTVPGPLLPPPLETGPTLREIVWGVDTREELARLGAELNRDRTVHESADGVFHTVDESGFGVGLTLARPKNADVTPAPPTRSAASTAGTPRWNRSPGPSRCACAMSR